MADPPSKRTGWIPVLRDNKKWMPVRRKHPGHRYKHAVPAVKGLLHGLEVLDPYGPAFLLYYFQNAFSGLL